MGSLWMRTRQPTNFPFNISPFLIYPFIVCSLVTGCVSYRVIKAVEGSPISNIYEEFLVGTTTLEKALQTLGAPDRVAELEGKNVLIYQKALLSNKGLSFGIPLADIWNPSFEFSVYGELVRYDLLFLCLTPDGILSEMVSEKGSRYPYFKTIFSHKKISGRIRFPSPRPYLSGGFKNEIMHEPSLSRPPGGILKGGRKKK
jgi:hypothetical protein